ncbi:MAG TPA: dihydrodipicolinate reductase C-terminal domain-containing protein [Gemmatimonadales bacterium]|jgi:4-hydroxy-tetrahydrodipicolinate reductase
MKLALLGHGRMARVVEAEARAAGHDLGAVITSRNAADAARLLPGHTVAIDFSVPAAVIEHVTAAVTAGVPLVQGTTGWQRDEPDVRRIVEQGGGALIYGANFSIGVNLFYRLVAHAARLFRGVAGYDPFIEEAHHAGKRDAPSGTALALQAMLSRELGGRSVPVTSTRAGHIPGIHRVGLDSAADQVLLIHTARSRAGFAAGALLGARWIAGRRGMYAFADVLDDILALARETERKDS